MVRTLLFLGLLAGLILGLSILADTPGHLTLLWGHTEYRVSITVGIVAIVLFGALAAFLWSLLHLVFRLPGLIGLYHRMRRTARGQEAVTRGLIAIGKGDRREAERYARDSRKLLGTTPLALLLHAQAAQLAGDDKNAEDSFKAMLDQTQTRDLGLRGLFIQAQRRGDAPDARRFAEEALQRVPGSVWALEAMLAFKASEQDWRGALGLIEQRISRRLIDKKEGHQQEAVLLAAAAREAQDNTPDEALDLALDALKKSPGLVPAAAIAAQRLSAKGDYNKATRLLETAYRQNPHPDLAQAYLSVRHGDSALDRLKRARTLARLVPHARDSRFALARAALDAREFAVARQALEALALEKPTVRVCLCMAELEEAESANEGLVRTWLTRASLAPRDPIWVADGVISERWLPVSPVSGKIGGFVWREPPQAPEQTLRARINATPAGFDNKTLSADKPLIPLLTPVSLAVLDSHPPAAPQASSEERGAPPGPEPAASILEASACLPASSKPDMVPSPFIDATTGEIRPIIPDDPGPAPQPQKPKARFSLFG